MISYIYLHGKTVWSSFLACILFNISVNQLFPRRFLVDCMKSGYGETRSGLQQLHSSYSFIRSQDCAHVQSFLLVTILLADDEIPRGT